MTRALIIGWRFDYSGWVGYWGGPDTFQSIGGGEVYSCSGTEGECSRQVFKTAKSARNILAKRYNISPDKVVIQRQGMDWNSCVEKALKRNKGA